MTLRVWLLGDGKPGHENQSLGLAEALGRRTPCEIHRISLTDSRGLYGRLKQALAASAELPRPDIIVAAGHATHPALLWLAWKHRARSVVLMRPSLPLVLFDLCIAPSHDFPGAGRVRKNLILTRGAMNRVMPRAAEKSGGLILIGGPSKTHTWDGPKLLAALTEITASGSWQLTDSRRTPAGFIDQIRSHLSHIEIFPHGETARDWLPGALSRVEKVWVTEDSVSMIYEALSSGAKVGLLPVPRVKRNSRVLHGLDQLIHEGYFANHTDGLRNSEPATAPGILREADRCAQEMIARINP